MAGAWSIVSLIIQHGRMIRCCFVVRGVLFGVWLRRKYFVVMGK